MAAPLPPLGVLVRRHDPDRFLTTLFAPAEHRETLWTLYAFNHELARAREAVREPFAALIRLQWWREVIEGARRRHEVAGPVGEALDTGRLLASDLAAMVDAREAEAEPIETMAAFEAYLMGTAGSVMVAAGRALGDPEPERLRRAGAAHGLSGVLRNVAAHARQGRCLLPEEVLAQAGLGAAAIIGGKPVLPAVRAGLASVGRAWLEPLPRTTRQTRAALLPAVFARRDLGAATPARSRTLIDQLRVALAGATGLLRP